MKTKLGIKRIILGAGLLLGLQLYSAAEPAFAETIRIGIGTQDATINTVTGGGVVRYYNLLEKYLPPCKRQVTGPIPVASSIF